MALLLVGAASTAFVLSLALTWTVRQLACSFGWASGPISGRHVHTIPVPRLGGVAVFIAIAGVVIPFFRGSLPPNLLLATFIPTAWMFAVGLTDDIFGLRAHLKLAGQIAGGVGLFCLGLRLPIPALIDGISVVSSACSFVLTVGWAVLVMNAVNLVDGLDGLACGSSASIVAAVGVLGWIIDDTGTIVIAAVSFAVIVGFACFNSHPASIFLGDSGSLVLGAIISSLTIRLMSEAPSAWLACPLMLAHPLGEVGISTLRRYLRADPIFTPDRRHLHHRLLDRGLSHAQASAALVLVSFLACLLGVMVIFGAYTALTALVAGTAMAVLATRELRYGEFTHFLRRLRRIPKEREMIGTHMQLEDLRETIRRVRSLTELRIALSECFRSMGFDSARLRVRSYDSSMIPESSSSGAVELSFPLRISGERMGTLDLCWSVKTGRWPFDIDFFSVAFLPVLCNKLEKFVHLYQELPTAPKLRGAMLPDILPSLAVESQPLSQLPLNS